MGGEQIIVLAPRSAIAGALIRRLHERGARIGVLGRDLTGFDGSEVAWSQVCDLTDFDQVGESLVEAKKQLGGLTGIVNCAGSILLKPAHLTSRVDFDGTIASNLLTAFAAVRGARAAFGREGGSVVLVSSAAASFGMGNHEAIAAAKGAIEGLVRSAAATYAPSGIRFNAVAPGLVETSLSASITAAPASRKLSESLHPLGYLGQPEDIASAIAWFLDPAQRWVTGQVLSVDGGLSRVQPRPRMSPAGS
jgi:NAD(P)-dependent dehydrogenase (short-subunit alcohol dehydrogenase family)